MKAIILAGGKGTRLSDVNSAIPKVLFEISNKPILEYQLEFLESNDIEEVYVSTGFMSELIEEFIMDYQSKSRLKINISKEDKPMGTGGALSLLKDINSDVLLLYGDVFCDFKFDNFSDFHKSNNSLISLFVHPNDHPHDSDLVQVDSDSRVTKLHYKDNKPEFFNNLANSGIYLIDSNVINSLKLKKQDFEKDILAQYISGGRVFAYNSPEYVKDMGTPERLKKVGEDFANGKTKMKNLRNKQKAIFLDRDGVINPEIGLITKSEDFSFLPKVSESIKMINSSNFLAIIITNQPSVAKGFCEISDIEDIHRKMETILGQEGAKIDKIYFCPCHPEKGHPGENAKYKRECSWRKPGIGMFLEASKQFNIDLASSFMIGDSSTDMLAANRAKVSAVLLETGYAGNDGKFIFNTDFRFKNLYDSVKYILSKYDNN